MEQVDDYADILRALSPGYDAPRSPRRYDAAPSYARQDVEQGDYDNQHSFDGPDEDEDEKYRDSPDTLHSEFEGRFGRPVTNVPHVRRNNTRRTVQLTKGNLVLDCEIPTRLGDFLPRKDEPEFLQTRSVLALPASVPPY